MRHGLRTRLWAGGAASRLVPLLALVILLIGCQDAGPPVAPTPDGPQFSHSPGHGLKGTIAFDSRRDGDLEIYVMNADGSGVTQVTNNVVFDLDPAWTRH
jgi:TolB protein